MSNSEEEICSILSKARSVADKSRKYLADLLGMDKSNIVAWESGARLPTIDIAGKIAQVYGLNEGEFIQKLQRARKELEDRKIYMRRLMKKRSGPSDMFFSGRDSRIRSQRLYE